MRTGSAQDRTELRLALVCYGGVSLAVYMHGLTKEVHHLIRASRAFDDVEDLDAPNPFPADRTEAAYFEALRERAGEGHRLSVTVDLIAGTSAGGINGVVLGKVLAQGGEQDRLRQLWVEEGDLRKLLRGWPVGGLRLRAALAGLRLLTRFWTPTSPLRGEVMSRLLVDALRHIDDSAAGQTGLLPPGGSLDLFVTLTDLHGFEVLVPTGAGGASQRDREHAQVLHFSTEAGAEQAFGEQATPALAFAARATASFPGAFAPVRRASFVEETGEPLDLEGLEQRFVHRYDADGASAGDAWFVDGGVLDNAPFDLVVKAIGAKRAQTQVERRLVYIQPDPGRPLTETAPKGTENAAERRTPTWAEGVGKAVLGVRGTHPVLRDLLALRDLNLQIAEVSAIARSQLPTVTAMLDEVLPQPRTDADLSWVVSGKDAVQTVSDVVHERAKAQLGAHFPVYCRLKVEAAAKRLADEIAHRFVRPPDSSSSSFVRAALGEWARGQDEWTDPDPTRLMELLGPVDIPYRERRLLFLLAGVNELYAVAGSGDGAPQRSDLDELKTRAWDLLDELRRRPGEVVEELDKTGISFLSDAEISDRLFDRPAAFAEEHAKDFWDLFKRYSAGLQASLGDGSTALWEAFQELTGAWDRRHRRALLSRYLAFPFWDGLIFPTVALSQLPQFTPIGVTQFSPVTAGALPTPDGGKLKGVTLHHFGGFAEAQWRENDYLWGRLDGVELLLRLVRDAGSSAPPSGTTPPASRGEAVTRAGGVRLRDGLRAVLESETDLRRITTTRERLAAAVDALPLREGPGQR